MASYKKTEYEVLRRRCAALHQQGWKQVAIAQALGLTQGWVSRTLTKYRQQGQGALAWRKPTGATSRLTDAQLNQLIAELNKGAEHHGFPGHIWTRPRVNEVIKRLFGVSYDPSQIGRLLRKVGWSRQNRIAEATATQSPPTRSWPGPAMAKRSLALKKAQTEGRVILYLDESAATADRLLLIAHVGADLGTTGQDPHLAGTGGSAPS